MGNKPATFWSPVRRSKVRRYKDSDGKEKTDDVYWLMVQLSLRTQLVEEWRLRLRAWIRVKVRLRTAINQAGRFRILVLVNNNNAWSLFKLLDPFS